MKLKIVCVDDQKELNEVFFDQLKDTGHEVIFFDNAKEAIKYIEINHKTTCFVFSDFKMPEINGFEFREAIVENFKDIPFAIITGFYDVEMAKRGMNLSICEFLEKPLGFEKLSETFEKFGKDRVDSIEEDFMMVNSFLEESAPMLDEIEDLILALESDPNDSDALKTYFRLLHTIKGTAACVGLSEIADYAHKYEDFVSMMQKGQLTVTSKVTDVLLIGFDMIKKLYDIYSNGLEHNFDLAKEAEVFNISAEDQTNENEGEAEAQKFTEMSSVDHQKLDKEEKISVLMSTLDDFMEMSGELTVIRNSIFKTTSKLEQKYNGDKEVELLNDYLSEMHKVSSNLQHNISELRKTDLVSVFRPLQRVVRDICKNGKKKVEFISEGDHIRVDSIISKVLSNSLIHLIRNGLDHGLEPVAERVSAGKNEEGKLSLSIYESGEEVIVDIIDDGRGINPKILKDKALEKGLYGAEELDAMSEQRLFQIIFESGFSTAQEITDISGRRVGMDMVRSSIENINGKIIIDSKLGEGTHFKIVLPIPKSVLIVNSLMLRIGEATFSVALDEIRETILVEQGHHSDRIRRMGDGLLLEHHGALIPLVDIGMHLGHEEDKAEKFLNGEIPLNIVLSRVDGFDYGLLVDRVDDFEEVVVKKLSPVISHLNIFGGSTLYGDGEIALFFNLKEVANYFNFTEKFEDAYEDIDAGIVEVPKEQILMFNLDHTDTPYAIPLEYVSRLEVFTGKSIEYTGSTPIIRYRDSFLTLVNLNSSMIENGDELLNAIVVSYNDRSYGLLIDEILDIATPIEELSENISEDSGIQGTYFLDESFVSLINVENVLSKKSFRSGNADKKSIKANEIETEEFTEAA